VLLQPILIIPSFLGQSLIVALAAVQWLAENPHVDGRSVLNFDTSKIERPFLVIFPVNDRLRTIVTAGIRVEMRCENGYG
jgi:hypothetical protein